MTTEHNTKTPSPRTGFFAVLDGLLRVQGSAAPPYSTSACRPVFRLPARFLAIVVGSCAALLLFASSAFAAAPEVVREEAGNRSPSGFILEVLANPNGASTKCEFRYGTEPSLATSTTVPCEPETLEGSEPVGASAGLSGLAPGTTYYYRAVLENTAHEKTEGAIAQVTTVLPPETPEERPASEITGTTATLNGVLNPANERKVEPGGRYKFLYSASATECGHSGHPNTRETPWTDGSFGHKQELVSAAVGELLPDTTYTFCLFTETNRGEEALGLPEHFTTAITAPDVGGESFANVGSSSVTLHAQIDPSGEPTTYHFDLATEADYTSSKSYSFSTPAESAGAGSGVVEVTTTVEGLAPDTVYHFRVVASNPKGATSGSDSVFSTFALAISGLPDGRGYELVSPLENGYAEVVSGVRAAADGSAVAYLGQASEQGGNGNNNGPNETGLSDGGSNQYLASRSPTGWTATDIQPTGLTSVSYRAFSGDLSLALLTSSEPLVPGAPAENALYSRQSATGSIDLLGPGLSYAASTPDGSHVLLQKGRELYELVGGTLSPVNVLPGGGGLAANASFGGPTPSSSTPDLSGVISGDGSRVFWSEEEPVEGTPLRLFVSVGVGGPGERTVQLDAAELGCVSCTSGGGGGLFWTATSDGSKVFFTDEKPLTADSNATAGAPDLYEYDLTTGTLTDLTPATTNPGEHANVVGVLGTSSDGSYVYFAAAGSLAGSGATPQPCSPAIEAQHEPVSEAIKCDVYALHVGEAPRLVATVTNFDGEGGITYRLHGGDWVRSAGRSSFVSGDGRVLVFKSIEDLTGFDSLGDQEIYSYQYGAGLTCVSCNPSGAPTIHGEPYEVDAELPERNPVLFASRDLSADGDRVFFETAEALVPQDSNGKTDVYEWERDGSGSCTRAGGCLYLLSGGTSSHNSHFVDASETGGDVFFISDAELVPADRGEYVQLWDARVGASEPLAPTACTGTGCQGVPPAPPIFATPPSVTITGVDDLAPPPAAGAKKATKKKTVKCAKGKTRNKHNQCVKARKKTKAKKSAHINRRTK
jgi:hypothetical protein